MKKITILVDHISDVVDKDGEREIRIQCRWGEEQAWIPAQHVFAVEDVAETFPGVERPVADRPEAS